MKGKKKRKTLMFPGYTHDLTRMVSIILRIQRFDRWAYVGVLVVEVTRT